MVILPSDIPSTYWWVGFDCNHSGDLPDPDLFEELLPKEQDLSISHLNNLFASSDYISTHKDLNYIVKECNRLATQLSEYIYNSLDFILD